MKKWMAVLIALAVAGISQAQVLSAWDFDGLADGSGRSEAVSTGLAAGVAWGNTTMCSIQSEALEWTPPDLSKGGDFSGVTIGDYSGKEGGIFRVEVDYVSAEMANTFAAHEEARVALGIRSSAGDQVGFRLRYDGHTNVMEVTEFPEGVFTTNYVDRNQFTIDWGNDPVFVVPGSSLGTNIHVSALYDVVAGTVVMDVTYDGVTSNAYNGALPDGFNMNELRWVVQANNGGAHWQLGDTVVTDNLVLTMLEEPGEPPASDPLTGVVEEWLFDYEVDGTSLGGLTNSAPEPYGLAKLGADKSWAFTTNGVLRFENGGTQAAYLNSAISQLGSTNGQYELRWSIPRAQVTGAGINNGATVSFGLRDSRESKSSFEVRLLQQNGSLILQKKLGTSASTIFNFGLNVLSNLSLRVVADYDTDTFDVYYKLGDAAEVLGEGNIGFYKTESKSSLDSIYTIAVTKAVNFGADDFFEVGELVLEALYIAPDATPEELYVAWLAGYDVGASTNLTDDMDGDLLDNLGEYAFGGDPSLQADRGNFPMQSQVSDGDLNYLEYVYYEREDAEARGLSSVLEVGTSLIAADWAIEGIEFVGSGASGIEGFNAVTNRIQTGADDNRFLRLRNEFTP